MFLQQSELQTRKGVEINMKKKVWILWEESRFNTEQPKEIIGIFSFKEKAEWHKEQRELTYNHLTLWVEEHILL